jgi:hypothetical protein
LFDVVGALHPAGRLASRLNGWQQQADEYAYDGDYHQEFD